MNTDPKIISATAYVIHGEALRQRRAWDQQGIHAAVRGALEDDGRDVLAVIHAGYEAVSDQRAETPGAIRWPGRYKPVKGTAAWTNDYGPDCAICGRSQREHDANEAKVTPDQRHAFEPDKPSEPSEQGVTG